MYRNHDPLGKDGAIVDSSTSPSAPALKSPRPGYITAASAGPLESQRADHTLNMGSPSTRVDKPAPVLNRHLTHRQERRTDEFGHSDTPNLPLVNSPPEEETKRDTLSYRAACDHRFDFNDVMSHLPESPATDDLTARTPPALAIPQVLPVEDRNESQSLHALTHASPFAAADPVGRQSAPRGSAFKRRGSQGSHYTKEVLMPPNPPILNIHAFLANEGTNSRTDAMVQVNTRASPGLPRYPNVEESDAAISKAAESSPPPMGALGATRSADMAPHIEQRSLSDPLDQPITFANPVTPSVKFKKQINKVVQKTKIPGPPGRRRKRIKDGQVVFKGHKSWEIVLSIQFGLHYTSELLRDSDDSEPTPADFRESLAFDFNPVDEQRTSVFDVNKYAKWVHPAPYVYRRIRAKFGVNEQDFLAATCSESRVRELPTPGKSGALFYITDDENYFMKTITSDEEKMLLTMLPSYYDHVSMNPDTLLTKYLAHFSVETTRNRHIRMVIMASVFNDSIFIDKKFDLKGSTYKRFAKPEELRSENVTLKDLDLEYPIYFNPHVLQELLAQLEKDTAFLEHHHVMDYSLLLGMSIMLPEDEKDYKELYGETEENGPYYIGYQRNADGELVGHRICLGIIDFLQRFRARKKMEYGARVLQTCSTATASVCPPSIYRRRFLGFIRRKLIAHPNVIESGPGPARLQQSGLPNEIGFATHIIDDLTAQGSDLEARVSPLAKMS